ncbi:MAG: hypothetical protein GX173_08410 [Ruminococcaceae bacterium]|nr:hypothetical protein [Oscillospiraceae bacterium]
MLINQTGHKRTAFLAGLLLTLFMLSSCSGLTEDLFGPDWTWPSLSTAGQPATLLPDQTSTAVETAATASISTRASSSSGLSGATATLDFIRETPAFDEQVKALLLAGLEDRARSISLDQVFHAWQVPEKQVQGAIDRIYNLFSEIYHRQPRFFYLNGSFQIYYSVLRDGDSEIAGMRIEPAYWSSTEALGDAALSDMISQVDSVVHELASQIARQTADPYEQLVLLQEWLVRHITYDATEDQGTNHAGSALLQGVTLCQGYAQSFQLVGQALGHDVRLISGEADGIGHAWNQVVLQGTAYHVDVTFDDPTPDEDPQRPVRHAHMFRSDEVFAQTHQWDRSAFLPCPYDGAFFYHRQNLVAADRDALQKQLRSTIASLDLETTGYGQVELLYTGLDAPGKNELETLFVAELRGLLDARKVYYRADWVKQVAMMQVSYEHGNAIR